MFNYTLKARIAGDRVIVEFQFQDSDRLVANLPITVCAGSKKVTLKSEDINAMVSAEAVINAIRALDVDVYYEGGEVAEGLHMANTTKAAVLGMQPNLMYNGPRPQFQPGVQQPFQAGVLNWGCGTSTQQFDSSTVKGEPTGAEMQMMTAQRLSHLYMNLAMAKQQKFQAAAGLRNAEISENQLQGDIDRILGIVTPPPEVPFEEKDAIAALDLLGCFFDKQNQGESPSYSEELAQALVRANMFFGQSPTNQAQ